MTAASLGRHRHPGSLLAALALLSHFSLLHAGASLAADPEHLYLREPPGTTPPEQDTGGRYRAVRKEDGTALLCAGRFVYTRDQPPTPPDSLNRYLSLHPSSARWTVTLGPASFCAAGTPSEQTSPAELLRSLPSAEPAPSALAAEGWERPVHGVWVYDVRYRVGTTGCPTAEGCLGMRCLEPEQGKTCAQCRPGLGDRLECDGSGGGSAREYLLIVNIGVVSFLLLVFLGWVIATNRHTLCRPRDLSVPMKRLGSAVARHRRLFAAIALFCAALVVATGLPIATAASDVYADVWAADDARLRRETTYAEAWQRGATRPLAVSLLAGSLDSRDDAANDATVTSAAALRLEAALLRVAAVRVAARGGGKVAHVGLHDLCATAGASTPCVAPSVLDCFAEGRWVVDAFAATELAAAVNVSAYAASYEARPSLHNVTELEFLDALARYPDGCGHWHQEAVASPVATIDKNMLVGALQLRSPNGAMMHGRNLSGFTEGEAMSAVHLWKTAVLEELEKVNDETDKVRISAVASFSVADMLDGAAKLHALQLSVGFVTVAIVAAATQFSPDPALSGMPSAAVGVALLSASSLAAHSCAALFGAHFNQASLQALPFISVALGLHTLFFVHHCFRHAAKRGERATTAAVMEEVFSLVGLSATLSAVCQACTLFVGMLLPVPAMRSLLAAAGLAVMFNWAVVLLPFCGYLAWESDRRKKPAERSALQAKPSASLLEGKVMPFMQRPVVSGTLCLLGLVLLVCSFAITWSRYAPVHRSSAADVADDSTYLAQGYAAAEDVHYLPDQRMFVTRAAADLSTKQGQYNLAQFYTLVATSKWCVVPNATAAFPNSEAPPPKLWLTQLYRYVVDNAADMGGIVVHDAVGNVVRNSTTVVDGSLHHIEGDRFAAAFHKWRTSAAAPPSAEGFAFALSQTSVEAGNDVELSWFAYVLDMSKLRTTSEWLRHVRDLRSYASAVFGPQHGGHAFPEPVGKYAENVEFDSMSANVARVFVIAACATFACCCLFSVSLRGALLVTAVSSCGTFEVASFAAIEGNPTNTVTVASLVIAFACLLDYSVKGVVLYEACQGAKAERFRQSVPFTLWPECAGALTSVAAFAFLRLSDYPFVHKTFAAVLLASCGVGIFHGALVIPALLQILGGTGRAGILNAAEQQSRTEVGKNRRRECLIALEDTMLRVAPQGDPSIPTPPLGESLAAPKQNPLVLRRVGSASGPWAPSGPSVGLAHSSPLAVSVSAASVSASAAHAVSPGADEAVSHSHTFDMTPTDLSTTYQYPHHEGSVRTVTIDERASLDVRTIPSSPLRLDEP